MKVLIVGGTGFISGEIARLAAEAGHEVVVMTRGEKPALGPWRSIRGDGKALLAHRDALVAEAPEVVVHAVAGTAQHGREAAEALAGTGAQLLVLGSMDVYDAFQASIRGQEVTDHPVDEDGPVTPIPFYYRDLMPDEPKRRDYDKNQMTAALFEAAGPAGLRASVYRLPMVYGPRDPQYPGRHGPIIRRILDGRRTLVLGLQDQNRLWTWGYVTNMAAGIVHAMGRPEVDGRIWNLGERTFRTKRRWAALYAAAAEAELDVRLVPDHLLDADEKPDQPPMHLLIDSGRFAAATGFVESVSLEDGIARTLEWARANPDCLGPSPDYAAEDALLATYDAAMASLPRLAGD